MAPRKARKPEAAAETQSDAVEPTGGDTSFDHGANAPPPADDPASSVPDATATTPESHGSDTGRGAWTRREGGEKTVDKTLNITDGDTGMRFQFNHITHAAEIKFEAKPSDATRQFLKDNGFRFDTDEATGEKVWHRRINFDTRVQERVDAKRVFWKAVDLVREERGLPARAQESPIPD